MVYLCINPAPLLTSTLDIEFQGNFHTFLNNSETVIWKVQSRRKKFNFMWWLEYKSYARQCKITRIKKFTTDVQFDKYSNIPTMITNNTVSLTDIILIKQQNFKILSTVLHFGYWDHQAQIFNINVDKPKKVQVKFTLVQALGLCTGCTAHRGSRGIALPFHDHALEGDEGSASCPGHCLPPGKTGTHCTGGWVGPRASMHRCGKSRPHWDSIPGPSSP